MVRSSRKGRGSKKRLFIDEDSEEEELPQEEEEDEEDEEDTSPEEQEEPIFQRLLLEQEPLREFMECNMRCVKCRGFMAIIFDTCTLATKLSAHCKNKRCSYIDYCAPPQAASVRLPDGAIRTERNTDYAVNVLYVLGFIGCGDGGREAARVLGMLGLKNDTTMESRSFPTIERRIGPTIRQLTQDIMLENLYKEVKMAMTKQGTFNDNVFRQWKLSIDDDNVFFPVEWYPKICCSADFAWQTRGGGNAFNSNSGFGILAGSESRLPLICAIKSKYCRLCSWGEPSDNHACLLNHHGSSKAMEPIAVAEQYLELFDKFHCFVTHLVTDDDSSIKSKLKYTHAAYMEVNDTEEAPRIFGANGKSKEDERYWSDPC